MLPDMIIEQADIRISGTAPDYNYSDTYRNYSNTVRQGSTGTRTSSGGGIGFGK